MPSVITASEQLVKAAAEAVTKTFDFTKWLADTGETISSVTSVTQAGNVTGATALTIGTPAVNSGEITIDGATIAVGKAVQALISVGQNLVHYTLTATIVTTGGQTFTLKCDLFVSDN